MRRHTRMLAVAAVAIAAVLPALSQEVPSGFAIAAKGGWWDADVASADGGPAFGIELSADNLLIEPPAGKLQHMWSWNHADNDGLRLDTVEWNAHWAFEVRPSLWLGFGPGIGWVWADGGNVEDSAGVQLGVSATYVHGHALFGIESRYQWTEAGGADNWLTVAKVGYRF